MTLQYIINLGNTIIDRCAEFLDFLNITLGDLMKLNSKFLPNFNIISSIISATPIANVSLLDVLFFGSLGVFIVYTFVKWVLDIVL